MPKLIPLIAKILQTPMEIITDASAPHSGGAPDKNTIESWDSWNALMMASEIETAFAVHFTTSEIASVKNVGDIKFLLRQKGIKEEDLA